MGSNEQTLFALGWARDLVATLCSENDPAGSTARAALWAAAPPGEAGERAARDDWSDYRWTPETVYGRRPHLPEPCGNCGRPRWECACNAEGEPTLTVHTFYVPPGEDPREVWERIAAGRRIAPVPGGGWANVVVRGGARIEDRWTGGAVVYVDGGQGDEPAPASPIGEAGVMQAMRTAETVAHAHRAALAAHGEAREGERVEAMQAAIDSAHTKEGR